MNIKDTYKAIAKIVGKEIKIKKSIKNKAIAIDQRNFSYLNNIKAWSKK